MTPVDALDTLILMGFKDEAEKAKALIVEKLSFDKDISVKNFEITIRLLGGLLSGYQMTGDERLLRLADDLGTRLLPVFDSPTGMPYMYVNLKTGKTSGSALESRRDRHARAGVRNARRSSRASRSSSTRRRRRSCELYKRRSKLGLVGEEIDVETGEWTSRATATSAAGSIPTTSTCSSARGSSATRTAKTMWRDEPREP